VDAERAHKKYKQMKTIVQFGLAVFAVAAFSALPSKAETPDIFTKHGLPLPGAYFKNKESQQPATIAVSKSGQGVGEQKQSASKAGKKHPRHVRSVNGDS
jgi:hypothetical protein